MYEMFFGSSGGRGVRVELILMKREKRELAVNFLRGLVLDRAR